MFDQLQIFLDEFKSEIKWKIIENKIDYEIARIERKRKWEIMTSDPKLLGKKRGYNKASLEYERIFREQADDYKKTIDAFKKTRVSFAAESDELIQLKEHLEVEKRELQGQIKKRAEEVSSYSDIPVSTISMAISGEGTITNVVSTGGINPITGVGTGIVLLAEMIYNKKKNMVLEYEKEGYLEAKQIYELKLLKLREDFSKEKREFIIGNEYMKELIVQLLKSIEEDRSVIAELNIISESF